MSTAGSDVLILLAPVGAGKSTRIRRMRYEGQRFAHLDVDDVIGATLSSNGYDLQRANRTFCHDAKKEVCAPLIADAKLSFDALLGTALKKSETAIVVDFAASGSSAWVPDTIARSQAAGKRVLVEGIYVDPLKSLPRTLTRNTIGLEIDEVDKIVADKVYLGSWLASYQRFPALFSEAVTQAGTGRLVDNNGERQAPLKLIADWTLNSGTAKPQVHDPQAYHAFQKLAELDPQTLPFSVKRTWSQPQGDDWYHDFSVKPRYNLG